MKYNIRFTNETFTVTEISGKFFASVYDAEMAIEKIERNLNRDFSVVVW